MNNQIDYNTVTATDDVFTAHQPDATQFSEVWTNTAANSDKDDATSTGSASNVVVMLHGRVLEPPPLPFPEPQQRVPRSATPVRVTHDPLQRVQRRRMESLSPIRWRSQSLPPRPGHLVEDFEELADEHRRMNATRRPLFDGDSSRTVSVIGRLGFPRAIRMRRLNVAFIPRRENNAPTDDVTQRERALPGPSHGRFRFPSRPVSSPAPREGFLSSFPVRQILDADRTGNQHSPLPPPVGGLQTDANNGTNNVATDAANANNCTIS